MEKKIKHMEMIQGVINRMAGNSFMLKGWGVTLLAGVVSLANKGMDQRFFLIAFVAMIFFCGLDTYYFQKERLYRALYDKVRQTNEEDIDFSMVATVNQFPDERNKYESCLCTWFELGFYGLFVLLSAAIIIIVNVI